MILWNTLVVLQAVIVVAGIFAVVAWVRRCNRHGRQSGRN